MSLTAEYAADLARGALELVVNRDLVGCGKLIFDLIAWLWASLR
jgi:hypothetical protein